MKKNSEINIKEFEKTEREVVSMNDLEGAFRQIVPHPDKPKTKSENREPTREELNSK